MTNKLIKHEQAQISFILNHPAHPISKIYIDLFGRDNLTKKHEKNNIRLRGQSLRNQVIN